MNKGTKGKVILVTGASSGMGLLTATLLHESGYRVFGALRRDNLADARFETVRMDVTDEDSVRAGVGAVLERAGRVDVAVNCAGYGICGAVEDTSMAEAQAQFDTNFFGVLRVCRAVLPCMRAQGRGLIINFSSLGGIVSAPFHGLYCASKFAVEGATEALRMEVARFGVHVALVQPGDFKTRFTQNRIMTLESGTNPVYRELCERSLAEMEKAEQNGPEPMMVARLVRRIIETPRPCLRYVAAPGEQRLVPLIRRLLPQTLFEKIICSHYKIR